MVEGSEMTYRIRFLNGRNANQSEMLIEAGSPNEALVKFHCTRGGPEKTTKRREQVTSICPEDLSGDTFWGAENAEAM
ncbi:MAG TPA: hypothetical protein DCX07_12795 [Phycisphaerales bacterium]|nr:hypothetical protein [Phycisphaerales bacterium]